MFSLTLGSLAFLFATFFFSSAEIHCFCWENFIVIITSNRNFSKRVGTLVPKRFAARGIFDGRSLKALFICFKKIYTNQNSNQMRIKIFKKKRKKKHDLCAMQQWKNKKRRHVLWAKFCQKKIVEIKFSSA